MPEANRLKALEEESAKLKRFLAETTLDDLTLRVMLKIELRISHVSPSVRATMANARMDLP